MKYDLVNPRARISQTDAFSGVRLTVGRSFFSETAKLLTDAVLRRTENPCLSLKRLGPWGILLSRPTHVPDLLLTKNIFLCFVALPAC